MELVKQFELSKESVRKALDVLVEEGRIEKIKRVGNRVVRTVLRVAYYPVFEGKAYWQEAIAAFEEAYPSIKVQAIATPFPAEFAEHGIADVLMLTNWDALKWREKDGTFSKLAECLAGTTAHTCLEAPFLDKECRQYACPFVFSPIVLCDHRRHFAECGLEEPNSGWTWYTLLKAARTLSQRLMSPALRHICSP